jgi:hypothetical protein
MSQGRGRPEGTATLLSSDGRVGEGPVACDVGGSPNSEVVADRRTVGKTERVGEGRALA